MTIRKYVVIPILALTAVTLFACAFLQPQEQEVLVRIAARRLAGTGVQIFPTVFKDLGKTARDACDLPDETMKPSQALELIAQTIGLTLQDKLLAADLKDLAALIGIRFDAAFNLIGITEDQQRLVKVAVCSFAEGVELYSQPKHITPI